MQIYPTLEAYSPSSRPLVVVLGNFDGMHLGHQALLKRVCEIASDIEGQAAVFTFQNHPQRVLHPQQKPLLLTAPAQKLLFFREIGIDTCFLLPFDLPFSKLSAEEFVKKILVEKLQVHTVVLGYNARFGQGRKGDGALMQRLASVYGFQFEQVPPVKAAGDFVSSSRVRDLLVAGNLLEVEACLGRPYSIFAKVIKGEGRGKEIGFPTANLESEVPLLLPEGVYPVLAREIQEDPSHPEFRSQGPWLEGVLNFGRRPTFKSDEEPLAEVFFLNFTGDLYGRVLEVIFFPRIREEKSFPSAEALHHQIEKDVTQAKKLFSGLKKH